MALRNRAFCKCPSLHFFHFVWQLKGAFHFLLGKLSSYIRFNSFRLLSKMKKTPKGHRNFHSGRNFFPIGQTTFEVNCRRVVQKKRSTVATYINKIKLLLTIETNALPQRKRKKYCLSPTKHETPWSPTCPIRTSPSSHHTLRMRSVNATFQRKWLNEFQLSTADAPNAFIGGQQSSGLP